MCKKLISYYAQNRQILTWLILIETYVRQYETIFSITDFLYYVVLTKDHSLNKEFLHKIEMFRNSLIMILEKQGQANTLPN
jgi:hypothetical protein